MISLDATDLLDAVVALEEARDRVEPPARLIAGEILLHAQAHLYARLRRHLIPASLPRTEQQAAVMLQHIGQELTAAGTALHQAAAILKQAGIGTPASAARQAGTRALAAAEGLVN